MEDFHYRMLSMITNCRFHGCDSNKNSTIRSENISCLIDSYSADLVHGVTRGNVITSKHFLLALGLHNITGQKKVVQIVNRLGHSISYDLTCEIESDQARKAQALSLSSSMLPLQPLTDNDRVLTIFWADNFDLNVDTQLGAGAINTAHLIAFQEASCHSSLCMKQIDIPRTKTRSIKPQAKELFKSNINPKKEPPTFVLNVNDVGKSECIEFSSKYFLWLWLRRQNGFDQIFSTFSGFLLKNRDKTGLVKTVTTYLPPLTSKVTEFATIDTYLKYLQTLSNEMNMPYVNVTLDVGAAINAFKLVWNKSETFGNVVIHLGDFHFMKENFQVSATYLIVLNFRETFLNRRPRKEVPRKFNTIFIQWYFYYFQRIRDIINITNFLSGITI